jgi:hypothetical protein
VGIEIPIEQRIAAKTSRDESGCLVWTAWIEDGYGRVWFDGRMERVHRVVWVLANGPIPVGLMIDHLCHNRACCELSHLRLVTRAQNGQNRIGAPKHSTTGVRGVRKLANGKYEVRVTANGTRHYCGFYDSLDEADAVAQRMRLKLHDPIPSIAA